VSGGTDAIRFAGPCLLLRRPVWLVSVVVTLVACGLGAVSSPALGDQLSSARARAAALTAEIAQDNAEVAVLGERYDEDQVTYQGFLAAETSAEAALATDETHVSVAKVTLAREAVDAYMNGGSSSEVSLFSESGEKGVLASEYRTLATGNLEGSLDALHLAEGALSAKEAVLQSDESAAQSALARAAAAQSAAMATTADERQSLQSVNGSIQSMVEAQQRAAVLASRAAARARLAVRTVAFTPSAMPPPPPGNFSGAIAAAETQIGVPYVWGGASPGRGFDCSGLVMWAFAQIGISFPHSAEGQYQDTTHIPLSDLAPGDLVFWGSRSYVDHVAIYVGGGNILQAPETGERVQIVPMWSNGLVGAGRP